MKGYIGFKNGLINGEQKYIENTVIEDEAGIVFYRLPHHLVEHYDFAKDFEFAEVEALDEVHTDDNEKFVTTKLKIGKKISVAELCKRSVPEFFEAFEFDKKIEEAKQTANYGAANAGDYGTANAGDYGTANAGNCGVANAGDYGAANAGDCGAARAGRFGAAKAGNCGAANAGGYGTANAGYCGAANAGDNGAANAGEGGVANAGDRGVANAGYCGAANAGDYGAANAGEGGVASAGNCGVAIVRENGISSVRTGGTAVAFDGWAKGEIGTVLILIETDDSSNIKHAKMLFVDGEIVKPDTYYRLEDGEVIEMEESKQSSEVIL